MAQPRFPILPRRWLLVRPDRSGISKILMTRRPETMDTYAGIYVFPGGQSKTLTGRRQCLNVSKD